MAFYIFQFGLLQPVASLFNSQLPVAAFTLLLLLIMLVNNSFKIKLYIFWVFVALSVYFFLNSLIFQESSLVILLIYIEFIIKSFSALLVGSLDIDGEELYHAFLKVAVLNFLALVWFPFVGFLDSMNYMRFGYAMIPSVIMFLYAIFSERKKLRWLAFGLVSLAVTFIYGSRGQIVVLILLFLLLFVFSKRISKKIKLMLAALIGVTVIFQAKFNLMEKIIDYLYFELGIQSYTLAKLRLMLNVGLTEASSGRDELYLNMWSYIIEQPLIGYGVGFSQQIIGYTSHNILLQILLESGVIGLSLWLTIWIFCLFQYQKINSNAKKGLFKVVTLVIALSLGRLLISSDMWLRPEYWFALSLLANFKNK